MGTMDDGISHSGAHSAPLRWGLGSPRGLPSPLHPAQSDSVSWLLAPSGCFSVKSCYRALCRAPDLPWIDHLWKGPLPLKLKIFVWQLLCVAFRLALRSRRGRGLGRTS